jgi:hypothetical protein
VYETTVNDVITFIRLQQLSGRAYNTALAAIDRG